MKALTVKQPWAWAILHGGKWIENRTRATSYRGPLAIHAGLGWDQNGADSGLIRDEWHTWARTVPLHPDDPQATRVGYSGAPGRLHRDNSWIDRGHIIAVADLAGCHEWANCCHPWGQAGAWHWELANVRALPQPIACRGALGLWTPPAEALDTLTEVAA